MLRFKVFSPAFSGASRQMSCFWCGFLITLLLTSATVLASTTSDVLSPYEQSLLLHNYVGEPLEQRVSRLESLLFGEPQVGDLSERQARLLQVLQATSSPSTVGSSKNEDPLNPGFTPFQQPVVPQRPADATDYPTVTAMERKVYGRDFIYDDITQRLERLERKIFGNSYSNLPMVDRVDKLAMRVPVTGAYSGGSSSAIQNLPSSSSQMVGSSSDVYLKLDALERVAFLESNYNGSGKLITERLDALEKKAYGSTHSGESVDTRVKRLIGTYEYPYNGASTQSRPAAASRPSFQAPSSSGRQNIQIGSGFSSNSTYHYSPELLEMLPNDVRAQVSTQSSGNGTTTYQSNAQGFTSSAPGTVIIEERTVYPGFQTYSNQPLQYQNHYSSPYGAGSYSSGYSSGLSSGGFSSGSTTYSPVPNFNSGIPSFSAPQNLYAPPSSITTQPGGITSYTYTEPLSPFGQQSTYTTNPYTTNSYNTVSPYGNGFPSYGNFYAGDPAVLQALNNLELNVYGRINTQLPVPNRLDQLEINILGQSYVGYPDAERINNLQRAYQAQALGKKLGNGKLGKVGRGLGSLLYGVPMTPPATAAPAK
jgi:hypothetical protein